MDANGTRFHLLFGEDDWSRCRTIGGAPAFSPAKQVYWNAPRHEVTLWPDAFRFSTARATHEVSLADRRGAARDRFGNWYWISDDEHSIQILSSGSGVISQFWPSTDDCTERAEDDGGFRARTTAAADTVMLRGLTVTEDHYLVAGVVQHGSERTGGMVITDLYSGGPARLRTWPGAFAPFDLAPRAGGGVWILDGAHRRVWELDRRFEIVCPIPAAPVPEVGGFSAAGRDGVHDVVARATVQADQGWPVPGTGDLIAIAALPAEGVLVLEREDALGFACVHWLASGAPRGAPASTNGMATHIDEGQGQPPFALRAHDFAFGARADDDPERWIGRVFIVAKDGNQAFAFGVELANAQLALHASTDYYPMRLFAGRALVAADGAPFYDCGDRWMPLVQQHRPRYVDAGEIWTPAFDGAEPGCVWHRMMLDACIPPGASVEVYTRASDDWRELTRAEWLSNADRRALAAPDALLDSDAIAEADLAPWRPEPQPYLRADGSELPYQPRESANGRGTWELLFQQARGRFLQVKLVLRGDGRSSPRIRALRAWYPRFSYLEHYLPAVYREQPESASFLDRFLANFEGTFTAVEDRIAAAQLLFDVATAPPDTLDWLGRWFGVALDPSWHDDRRRLFLRHAMEFFAARGTMRGLQMALRLALDECVDDRLFSASAAPRAAPVRIIERFRARRTPLALLGDVRTAVPGPQRIDSSLRWVPVTGGADLHRRYHDAVTAANGAPFPLVKAGAPGEWSDFAQRTLGFVPRVAGPERARWQSWLRREYRSSLADLRDHFGADATFDAMTLPSGESHTPARDAWTKYLAESASRERALWQDFLARRYRTVAALNAAWRTKWTAFARISIADQLPIDGAPLADWFQFEGTVMAMHHTAHQFTVMLPVPKNLRTDTPSQQRRLALAKSVLDLEKPAHTVFDMRFYWAMFRLGEARLGDDTVIDLGSRAPELMSAMVLGTNYLAESFLAAHSGADAPSRTQIGRDRVGRSARLGGP